MKRSLDRYEQEVAEEHGLKCPVLLGDRNYLYNIRDMIVKAANISYDSACEVAAFYAQKGIVKNVFSCYGYCGYILIDEKFLTPEEIDKVVKRVNERSRCISRSEPVEDTFADRREERAERRREEAFERNGRMLSYYERRGE